MMIIRILGDRMWRGLNLHNKFGSILIQCRVLLQLAEIISSGRSPLAALIAPPTSLIARPEVHFSPKLTKVIT